MKNDNRIEGRVRPDKVEWAKKKIETEFQGSDTAFIDWLINAAMQQDGKAADTTTADGRYMIKDGQLYELQSFRPGGPGAWVVFRPEQLMEKLRSKSDSSWKRDIEEQRLQMEKEKHSADMTLKKVSILRAQKRYAPETVPQKCKVEGCSAASVVFANMAALNAHLKEYHHDRYTERSGGINYSQGVWYQGGQPVLKWNGAVHD